MSLFSSTKLVTYPAGVSDEVGFTRGSGQRGRFSAQECLLDRQGHKQALTGLPVGSVQQMFVVPES